MYNGQLEELKRRIAEVEREHARISLERKVVERTKDDHLILAADDSLRKIEKTLEVLYAQLPPDA